MADVRLTRQGDALQAVTYDLLLTPAGQLDATGELETGVTIALLTDARAEPDDDLPDPRADDRRGWWGDLDAEAIWDGWPIGSKLWLRARTTIRPAAARQGATTMQIRADNPAASIRGSIPPAAAFEAPQREIVSVIAESGDQTPSNDDLKQLLKAIRGGRLTTFVATGSANALAISAATPHTTLFRGLPFRIFPSLTNTQSAVTLTVNGTLQGAIVRTDGSPLAKGDIEAGCPFDVVHDGSRFRLMGPGRNEIVRFLETGTLYVDRLNGNDANDGLTPATALLTIGEARIRSTRFYQRGMPLLIKLTRSGTYPLPASGPILSGAQIIQGDPAAQDSYILEGATGGTAASVIGSGGLDLTLEGLTVLNPTPSRYTVSSSRGGTLVLNRVTLKAVSPLSVAHAYCSGFAGMDIGTNVIWDGSAAGMVSVRKGEIAFTSNSQSVVRNNPTWSDAAASAFDGGTIIVRGGSDITGNATGRRYDVDTNAVIRAGGAGYEFFRGSTAGVTDRGGIYIP